MDTRPTIEEKQRRPFVGLTDEAFFILKRQVDKSSQSSDKKLRYENRRILASVVGRQPEDINAWDILQDGSVSIRTKTEKIQIRLKQ